jgi:crotonobetainyl-CoA:carnitine CoA-transferase CaiB-like acyl-CoA transferase
MAVLRDLGAEVLRVERLRTDGVGPYDALTGGFPMRSLVAGTGECALDLKNESGREAFLRLAREASVVLDGFRPGVAERLGIDAAHLLELNPQLVHAAISGYGQSGPLRQRAGHDVNYLAETGALAPGNPLALPGTTFADGLAGMGAAINVLGALLEVRASGRGRALDLAIVDAPLMLMSSELEHFWATGESRGPGDTHLTGRWPWYGLHHTPEGAVAVGAVEPQFHAKLCERLGHPELVTQQYAEGDARRAAHEALGAAFATATPQDLEPLLDDDNACASPVRSTAEVAASPLMQRALRPGVRPEEQLVRTVVRLDPAELRPEPTATEALARRGFTQTEIEALRSRGALASDR